MSDRIFSTVASCVRRTWMPDLSFLREWAAYQDYPDEPMPTQLAPAPVAAPAPVCSGPSFELLEGRALMANVATALVNGNLTLTDNGSINVTISQPAANQIKLTPAAGTTINGQASAVTISGVTGDLAANLGSGNDTVTFKLTSHDISVHNLTLSGGSGNKTVQTTTGGSDHFLRVHGNYRQVFGDGFESTHLNQFKVDGSMTVNHANGGSFVFLGVDPTNLGTQFNRVSGNLIVDNVTSSGANATGFDVNALEETNVGGFIRSNMAEASGVGGWTTVGSLSSQSVEIGGNVTLTAHSGFLAFGDFNNFGMEVRNAHVQGDVVMNLGSGIGNTALFGGGSSRSATTAHDVRINGTGAHDTVTIGASRIADDLSVELFGAGANSIYVDKVSVTDDTSLAALGGANTITIDNLRPGSVFGDRVDISMTGGNNLLSINSQHRTPNPAGTTFNGPVHATLGTSGHNTLMLGLFGAVDFDDPSTFNGGGSSNNNIAIVGSVTGVAPTFSHFS